MLKNPKPQHRRFIRTGAKILFVAEAILFAGTYALWYRLNRNRDFRFYMNENYPTVLDAYYKIGETVDSSYSHIRRVDNEIWGKK